MEKLFPSAGCIPQDTAAWQSPRREAMQGQVCISLLARVALFTWFLRTFPVKCLTCLEKRPWI